MPYTKEEKAVYEKARYERKMNWLKNMLGNKCVQCKSEKDLQFHHKEPKNKSAVISSIWSYGFNKIKEELEKCELLCKECHKEYHIPDDIRKTTLPCLYCGNTVKIAGSSIRQRVRMGSKYPFCNKSCAARFQYKVSVSDQKIIRFIP